MGDSVIILENFHVFVPQGEGQRERKVPYTKGLVVEAADIPEGQSADNWIAQGLAKAV